MFPDIFEVRNILYLIFVFLAINDLYYLHLGRYGMTNAISYYAEQQKEGIFKYKTEALDYSKYGISTESPLLVKAYKQSRCRGKQYHIFILLNKGKAGRETIICGIFLNM